ncbi:MAG TPA: response regulator [Hanamia sp.]
MDKKKDILIIDDDSKNIFALAAVLKSKRHTCLSASSAADGFDILSKRKDIGVVLMDMMMPDMDGYEALGKMRENEKMKNIPVIAVTAQTMTGDKEKRIEARADGYVSKPINVEELEKLLNHLI